MAGAARFVVWMIPAAGIAFTVHPVGVRPGTRGSAAGGPLPVCGPVPLGYAEALCGHLQAIDASSDSAVAATGSSPARGLGRWLARERPGRPPSPRVVRQEARRFAERHFPWAWVDPLAGQWERDAGVTREPGRESASPRTALVAAPHEVAAHAARILSGRRLFSHELTRALAELGVSFFGDLEATLDPLVHRGEIRRLPGVGLEPHGSPASGGELRWRCQRCLSPNVGWYPCHRCRHQTCPQCDDCRALGVSSSCLVLYEKALDERALDAGTEGMVRSAPVPAGLPARDVRVSLPFALSPSQEQLAKELAATDRDVLVWAACGSGKTEVTLEAIGATVRRGGRALFALPRRDVVDQLGERLKAALPGVECIALRGGTGHRHEDVPVVVATVHQAVRFCQRFDLVIVDEVDAYPLDREPWLLAALERAMRPGGRLIMMTATPPERLLLRLGLGDVRCLTLPGRPHGHPLPVPEVVKARDLSIEGLNVELPRWRAPRWLSQLDEIIRESVERGRRVLVFVPSVRLTGIIAGLLTETGVYEPWNPCERERRRRPGGRRTGREESLPTPQKHGDVGSSAHVSSNQRRAHHGNSEPATRRRYRLAAVHAADELRSQKIAAFATGAVDLLVSTSILERGITLPRLDVVVFAADAGRVYDERALVQMAGRVGRSPDDPTGRVVFLARSITPAMRGAIAAIQRFNAMQNSSGLVAGTDPTLSEN